MDNASISCLSQLSATQKSILKRGNINSVADVLLSTPEELARKCKVPPHDMKTMFDLVISTCNITGIELLEDVLREDSCTPITTGDALIDLALGGGIRTGMVWEIAGESAAGKSQFALQLALLVQLSTSRGGLDGSCCFLNTSSRLPTTRLLQIRHNHSLLSTEQCGLEDIHTITTPNIHILINVLENLLPGLLENKRKDPTCKPVKLLVIDALGELFHLSAQTSTKSLVERSQSISEISHLLHSIASKHKLAVVVLNEVVDAFDRHVDTNSTELNYNSQSRLFSRADSIPGEDRKEVSLGLVWANQVNARIMLTRTGRRRYVEELQEKRLKTIDARMASSSVSQEEPQLIRRLSVIFSSVAPPTSLDYIVTTRGITALPGETLPRSSPSGTLKSQIATQLRDNAELELPFSSQVAPLDIGAAETQLDSEGPDEEEA